MIISPPREAERGTPALATDPWRIEAAIGPMLRGTISWGKPGCRPPIRLGLGRRRGTIAAYQVNDANQRMLARLKGGSNWFYGYDALGQVTKAGTSFCCYDGNGNVVAPVNEMSATIAPTTSMAPSAKSSAPPGQWRSSTPSCSPPSSTIGKPASIITATDITTPPREGGSTGTQLGASRPEHICVSRKQTYDNC